MIRLLRKFNAKLSKIPPGITLLVLRIALAVPFFKSGLTKWDGFGLSTGAKFVFQEEFRLHLGFVDVPYPFPILTATLVAIAEIVLPILLVLGLGTRFVALAIIVMICMIQLTVPDGWPIHITWFAMALALVTWGGGGYSVESLIPSAGPTRRDKRVARKDIARR